MKIPHFYGQQARPTLARPLPKRQPLNVIGKPASLPN